MENIEQLLASLELSQHAPKFKQEEIDLKTAKGLTIDELKDLGLTLGARKKLYEALHPASPSSVPAAPEPSVREPPPPVTPISNVRRHRLSLSGPDLL